MDRQERIDAEIAACTECGTWGFSRLPDCEACTAAIDEKIAAETKSQLLEMPAWDEAMRERQSVPVRLSTSEGRLMDYKPDDAESAADEIVETFANLHPAVTLSWHEWEDLKELITRTWRGMPIDDFPKDPLYLRHRRTAAAVELKDNHVE